MASITIDSTRHRKTIAEAQQDGKTGMVGKLLGAVFKLATACRNRIALAMMSERDLDDLGLLPSEVRAEHDAEIKRTFKSRHQAATCH